MGYARKRVGNVDFAAYPKNFWEITSDGLKNYFFESELSSTSDEK